MDLHIAMITGVWVLERLRSGGGSDGGSDGNCAVNEAACKSTGDTGSISTAGN